MRNAGRREAGFTLLEVIVSVTLVAAMAVAIWSVFRISLQSWSRGTADIDSNQRHRSILDLVKKQLASIYGVTAPINIESGGVIYPIFWGDRESVQFVSLVSLRFHDNPGLTLVSYELRRNQDPATFQLIEREERYIGVDPSRESFFDRHDETVVMVFDNLTSFSFEYLDPGNPLQQMPARWVDGWNPREAGRLPVAMSLTMIAREPSGRTFSRHMVVPILATPIDPRLSFVNPLDSRPRRPRDDDPRAIR